jgi:hypothetical protein
MFFSFFKTDMGKNKGEGNACFEEVVDEIGVEHDTNAEERAPWWQVLIVAAACGGVSALCYSNAFDADFVFDDTGAIVENPDVVGQGTLWEKLVDMTAHDYWGNDMRISSHKSYRPLTILSFRLNWMQAGGKLNSEIFHGTNVCLHVAVTFMLIIIIRLYRILPSSSEGVGAGTGDTERGAEREIWGLGVMGVLFAAHPIHCEAVTGLVGRADVLAALLVLMALLVYHPAVACKGGGVVAAVVCIASMAGAAVLIVCATLCKETGYISLTYPLTYGSPSHTKERISLFSS